MSCHDVRMLLGAYVLDAVEPAERSAVEAHLPGCDACRGELSGLQGLPRLLGLLRADGVERIPVWEQEVQSPTTSPGQFDRLLHAAASHRARRHWLVAVAAALLLITGGGALAIEIWGAGRAAPGSATWAAADPGSGTRAEAQLTAVPSGTSIELTLSGVPAGTRCRLVVKARDGSSTTAASWQADYLGQAQVTGSSSTPLGQIESLSVVTPAGPLLRLSP